MRDVFPTAEGWYQQGEPFAIAVVIKTWGSSPREVGSWMVVNAQGAFQGSVSGGCVESAVIQEALETIENKRPKKIHFGVADETAWEVGLACGGEIDVYLRPFPLFEDVDGEILMAIKNSVVEDRSFSLSIILDGPEELQGRMYLDSGGTTVGLPSLDLPLSARKAQSIRKGVLDTAHIHPIQVEGVEFEAFSNTYSPTRKLIIVGGAHISIALASYAKNLGYRVFVIDPRGVFGSPERFPDVDELIKAWPDQGLKMIGLDAFTAVAVLSHDPKLDDPALQLALPSEAFYVGALGSRKTQTKRRERLLEHGMDVTHIQRLHGPIGLDLGGSSPEEIALSIMAEIVSIQTQELSDQGGEAD